MTTPIERVLVTTYTGTTSANGTRMRTLITIATPYEFTTKRLINPRRMRRRVTVVVLCVCVCVCLSVCYHEISCLPRFYVANKVL